MDEPNLPANQTFLEEWMARSVFRNLLDGLQYLHCNGILHRDIKPENIVYSERPSFGRGHWTENFDQVGSAVAGSVAGVLHVGTSVSKGLIHVTGDVLEGVASTVAHGAKDAWRVSSKALHHSLSSSSLGDRYSLGDPLSSDSPSPMPATPRSSMTRSFRGGAMSGAVAPRAGVAAATVVASINGLSTAVAHATVRFVNAASGAIHDAVDEVHREVSLAGEVAGDLVDGVVGKGLTHTHWAPPAKLLDFGISQVCVRACVDGFAEAKEKTTRFRSKRRVLRSSTSYFNDTLEKATGTPPYFAPEMLVGKPFRGRPADVWAAGVTLAMITGGRMPYWAENVPEIWRQIERDEPVLAEHLSPPLRELLLLMLRKDPAERPTLAALQEHPWVTDNGALPVSEPPATFTVDEADVATAVQRAFVGLTLFKCASKWKRLPARKRAAREAAKRHGFVSHADWAPDKPFICHDPPSAAAEALSRSSVQKKRGDPPNLQKV
jgi:serine/threonine protein kinase